MIAARVAHPDHQSIFPRSVLAVQEALVPVQTLRGSDSCVLRAVGAGGRDSSTLSGRELSGVSEMTTPAE